MHKGRECHPARVEPSSVSPHWGLLALAKICGSTALAPRDGAPWNRTGATLGVPSSPTVVPRLRDARRRRVHACYLNTCAFKRIYHDHAEASLLRFRWLAKPWVSLNSRLSSSVASVDAFSNIKKALRKYTHVTNVKRPPRLSHTV